MTAKNNISCHYHPSASATLYAGDRLGLLSQIPSGAAQLIVTSPPYNIGKKYEKRVVFERYMEQQEATLAHS
jgi:DNA modification methylase